MRSENKRTQIDGLKELHFARNVLLYYRYTSQFEGV